MESILPLLFALGVGFTHAFEADHLIAISNIVTHRSRTKLALKDGVFWGLGHTSTILLIGGVIILGKFLINESIFGYLEGVVGVLLIVIGVLRLRRLGKPHEGTSEPSGHRVAYGVGLVHGLAGSGAVVLLAMAEISGTFTELFYLLSFGAGSIAGMLLAAGIFSLPFTTQLSKVKHLKMGMSLLSSVLCIGYGALILWNIM
ncbi:MAG: urease accessory protein [Bacteroidota bacterium]